MIWSFWKKYGENWRGLEKQPDMVFTSVIKEGVDESISRETEWAVSEYFSTEAEWGMEIKKALEYVRGKVLEVGCGAGRFLKYFQDKKFDIIGIDPDQVMIDICKERGLKCELKSVQNTGYPDNSFDTILMLGNMIGCVGETIEDIIDVYKEIKKLLKVDGIVVGSSYYKTDISTFRKTGRYKWMGQIGEEKIGWYFTLDKFKEIVETAGFKVVKFFESEMEHRTTYAYVLEAK